ncbi:MAG: hypothetical protein CMP10_20050 [Zetaproteobacteria bacterium]|nr:hypothetical protein [Pseudobdellovibrionaceae bacterium]
MKSADQKKIALNIDDKRNSLNTQIITYLEILFRYGFKLFLIKLSQLGFLIKIFGVLNLLALRRVMFSFFSKLFS